MNPRRIAGPALALALLAVLPAAALSQEEGYAFRLSNFSLEFYGGVCKIDPADLNNHAIFEEAYLQFYWVKYYDYLHSIYGDNYVVTSTRTGDSAFRQLKKAVPYGFRLRYQASPTFALTLGIQYLDGTQLSNVGMTFDVRDRRPDSSDYPNVRTIQYQNTGFTTQAKAWMPEFGAHFGWDISAVLRWEISIAFGPIFAQCRTFNQRHVMVTTADGYQSDSVYAQELKGSVTGLSGELGAGLFIRPLKYARLFIEGSYIFRELGELTGSGWSRASFSDSNSVYSSASANWTGTWFLQPADVTQSWGRFTSLYIQNQYTNPSGNRRFNPDLSGFQLKMGVGFVF
jgi:hypothetical protein